MSTLAKTYTFTAGTTAVAAEVNTNFDDIVSYVNTNAIVKDGAVAMTAALSLVNAEPSGSNVAVRRKSAYRSSLGGHPAGNTFTVGGGTSGTYVSMGDISDPFGYTPDYTYDMLIHLTGCAFLTGAGLVELNVNSPVGTPINILGPGVSNSWAASTYAANGYVPISVCALKQNIAGGTVPTYTPYYKISGVTAVSIYGYALCWINPSTRQLPN